METILECGKCLRHRQTDPARCRVSRRV